MLPLLAACRLSFPPQSLPWVVISRVQPPDDVNPNKIALGPGIVSDDGKTLWIADPLLSCNDLRTGKLLNREKTYIGVKRDGAPLAFSDSQWGHLGLGPSETAMASGGLVDPLAASEWPVVTAFTYARRKGDPGLSPVFARIDFTKRGKHPNREFLLPIKSGKEGLWLVACRELPGGALRIAIGVPGPGVKGGHRFRIEFYDLAHDSLRLAASNSLNANEAKLRKGPVILHGGTKPMNTTRFAISPTADRVIDCYPTQSWFDVQNGVYHSLSKSLSSQYQLGFMGSHLVAWTVGTYNAPDMVEIVGDRLIRLGPYRLVARNAKNSVAVLEASGANPGFFLVGIK